MLLRGGVRDLKPGHLFSPPDHVIGRPLQMHHMVVDLVVAFPSLEITDAEVVFETFPQPGCPGITKHYRELIGLSIARGFTHEVRQRFGGPRGCTHVTALLQAMGPVAVQCLFSMRRADQMAEGGRPGSAVPAGDGGRQAMFMKDTCHVWAEEGPLWQGVTVGRPPARPLSITRWLAANGVEDDVTGSDSPG
jgi:hypothetical protein